VFCRGPSEDKLWSFVNEAVYWCGANHALRTSFYSLLQMTRRWVDRYGLLRCRDFAGRTVLHHAIFHGQAHAVNLLLESGASPQNRLEGVHPSWKENVWRVYEFKGLSALEYAKTLRNCTPNEKADWANIVPFEITNDDIDAIIQHLTGANVLV
jgi:hypothetical protein